MGRLIDADKIDFGEVFQGNSELIPVMISLAQKYIDKQPTAYDVDAVVAELEEHKIQYGKLQFAHNDANMVCVYVGKEQAIDCAIDVVKRGWVK